MYCIPSKERADPSADRGPDGMMAIAGCSLGMQYIPHRVVLGPGTGAISGLWLSPWIGPNSGAPAVELPCR